MRKTRFYGITGVILAAAVVFSMPGVTRCTAAEAAMETAEYEEDIFAAENTRKTYSVPGGGKLYYEPDTGTIAWADGDMEELTIPARIDGTEIRLIGRWALSGLKKLKKIIV